MVNGVYYVTLALILLGGKRRYFGRWLKDILYHCFVRGAVLALCNDGKYVIRAEGQPRFAYERYDNSSVGNLLMDYSLSMSLRLGYGRCCLGTTIGYFFVLHMISFPFFPKILNLNLIMVPFWLDRPHSKGKLGAIGFRYLSAREAVISLFILLMNNIFSLVWGGEAYDSCHDAIDKWSSNVDVCSIPCIWGPHPGVFLPIVGFNYASKK